MIQVFINLFKKIYLVDEANIPNRAPDIDWRYLNNYRELKKEHATLRTLYRELMTNILPDGTTNSAMILLIVKQADINMFIQDYCNYLGLDYEAYSLLIKHSKFCTKFIDNCNEVISRNGSFPVISKKDYVYKPQRIVYDLEFFPAEYAINCINKSLGQNKYNYFRIYDIYNMIKEYQIKAYRIGLPVPEIFERFNTSDQSAKIMGNIQIEEKVKQEFIKLGLDTSLFTRDVSEYIKLNTYFGYNKYTIFKFNLQLARYLKKVGYRIDERKMERDSKV